MAHNKALPSGHDHGHCELCNAIERECDLLRAAAKREQRPRDALADTAWSRHVVMDGVLHIERQRFKDETGAENLEVFVGWTRRPDGGTSLYALHALLEHLNGRTVRVVIELRADIEKELKP